MPEIPPFGFLNVNKPLNITSHDVVARVRRAFAVKKVGHAGTLDPLAAGVLVLCVGAATRLSEYVLHATKRYLARVHLGVTTDTYDAEGRVLSRQDISHITRVSVEQALAPFTGEIAQIPPMYSAVKQGGRKLYELARAGQTVERETRRVAIERVDLIDWSPPECTLDITCSAGTYIRSLVHDLGQALGVGAYLAGLTRTASGGFAIEDAVAFDTLVHTPNWTRYLIPIDVGLGHLPELRVDAADADHILHGRAIRAIDQASEGQFRRAYSANGVFIAIVEARAGRWRPHKVFLPQT